MERDCYVHEVWRRGPVNVFAPSVLGSDSVPQEFESATGGSSCIVSMSGPQITNTTPPDPLKWQGLQLSLEGRIGSVWVPLRRCWAPPYAVFSSPRQMLQYQGAAVAQFKVKVWLAQSGMRGSEWPTEVTSLQLDCAVGHGSSGPSPGASFLLTGRSSVMGASDMPQVGASPERRRLVVELLGTTPGTTVGMAWNPLDASPASWVPLRVGEPRVFETSAPVWFASDPPNEPTDIAVIEELA